MRRGSAALSSREPGCEIIASPPIRSPPCKRSRGDADVDMPPVPSAEAFPGQGPVGEDAGAVVQIVAREGNHVTLRLRSGEMRKVLSECRAVIGEVGNSEHSLISLGKAGAKRWRGVRPTVRGVAMNPVDHPHGGGEGRTSGGRHPVSPWGFPTKGAKTRSNKRTDKMIVRRRSK